MTRTFKVDAHVRSALGRFFASFSVHPQGFAQVWVVGVAILEERRIAKARLAFVVSVAVLFVVRLLPAAVGTTQVAVFRVGAIDVLLAPDDTGTFKVNTDVGLALEAFFASFSVDLLVATQGHIVRIAILQIELTTVQGGNWIGQGFEDGLIAKARLTLAIEFADLPIGFQGSIINTRSVTADFTLTLLALIVGVTRWNPGTGVFSFVAIEVVGTTLVVKASFHAQTKTTVAVGRTDAFDFIAKVDVTLAFVAPLASGAYGGRARIL